MESKSSNSLPATFRHAIIQKPKCTKLSPFTRFKNWISNSSVNLNNHSESPPLPPKNLSQRLKQSSRNEFRLSSLKTQTLPPNASFNGGKFRTFDNTNDQNIRRKKCKSQCYQQCSQSNQQSRQKVSKWLKRTQSLGKKEGDGQLQRQEARQNHKQGRFSQLYDKLSGHRPSQFYEHSEKCKVSVGDSVHRQRRQRQPSKNSSSTKYQQESSRLHHSYSENDINIDWSSNGLDYVQPKNQTGNKQLPNGHKKQSRMSKIFKRLSHFSQMFNEDNEILQQQRQRERQCYDLQVARPSSYLTRKFNDDRYWPENKVNRQPSRLHQQQYNRHVSGNWSISSEDLSDSDLGIDKAQIRRKKKPTLYQQRRSSTSGSFRPKSMARNFIDSSNWPDGGSRNKSQVQMRSRKQAIHQLHLSGNWSEDYQNWSENNNEQREQQRRADHIPESDSSDGQEVWIKQRRRLQQRYVSYKNYSKAQFSGTNLPRTNNFLENGDNLTEEVQLRRPNSIMPLNNICTICERKMKVSSKLNGWPSVSYVANDKIINWHFHLPPPPPVPVFLPAAQLPSASSSRVCFGNIWTEELHRLSKCGWYWGPISREEAKKKMLGKPDGSFLVRDSSDNYQLLSLYVRSVGKTLHLRIIYFNGMFSFHSSSTSGNHANHRYRSVIDLVEQTMKDSENGAAFYSKPQRFVTTTIDGDNGVAAVDVDVQTLSHPIRILSPISRFTQVRSLQFICRFSIRLNTRIDLLGELPLPKRIIQYLEEGFFF
ncbi:suppressor of cytokine signaling 7 [Chamberlinius hualienensis]